MPLGGGVETGVTITCAVLTTDGSACTIADTVTIVDALTFGAAKRPVLLMFPFVAVQVTAVFALPVTVAVNCWDAPGNSEALEGEMESEIGVLGGGVTGAFTDTVTPATVLLNAAVIDTDVSDETLPVVTVKPPLV